MGKLIDPERLARAKENRDKRKIRILKMARSTFSKLPFVEVDLDGIGQAADVDRGVASLYFRSKEELFLRILREELADWYDSLERMFEGADGQISRSELAALLASGLADRPELTRFLTLEPVVLEQNLDAIEVYRFQRWRLERMGNVAALIERRVDGFAPGEGIHVLYLTQLLVSALQPAADPKGAAAYDIGDPDFAAFRVEFEPEMRRILGAILETDAGS